MSKRRLLYYWKLYGVTIPLVIGSSKEILNQAAPWILKNVIQDLKGLGHGQVYLSPMGSLMT